MSAKICKLDGNTLKIIAAVTMLIDHIGMILLPEMILLRVIGRLSFPIFAFMVAEGARYTKNKLRYLLTLIIVAIPIQLFYYFYNGETKLCVLVTFALAVTLIYSLDCFKGTIFAKNCTRVRRFASSSLVILTLALVTAANIFLDIDYGIAGCLLPVFASILRMPREFDEDTTEIRPPTDAVIMMGMGLLLLSIGYGGIQYFSLLSLPLLLLYSGKRGRYKMKYFFYVFYPAHLLALELIAMLLLK